jgi:hypothetical protein
MHSRLVTRGGIGAVLAHLDWDRIEGAIEEHGYAKTPPLLTLDKCAELIALYADDSRFRSRIDMARYRFGIGEYKYFARRLPGVVDQLRECAYPPLAAIANRWAESSGSSNRYPAELDRFLAICAEHGQPKPTPLLLYYETGGYNCLHQDLYGEVAFPLQMTCVLSRRGIDYTGGELLLVEQRPRAQSSGQVVTLEQGEAVVFPNSYRPVRGARGYYRVNMRHGVSRLLSGSRYSLGIIFHDAK